MRKGLAGLLAGVVMAAAPLGAIGTVLLTAGPAAAQSWSVTTQAEDGFAVELPGTPSVNRREQEVGGGAKIPLGEFTVTVNGGDVTIGAAKFGVDPTAEQIQGGYTAALDSGIAADSGTQTWRRARTVSGFAAMEAEYTHTIDGATWKSRVLVVFARQRFFTVSVRAPITAPAATAERVMNSFRVL